MILGPWRRPNVIEAMSVDHIRYDLLAQEALRSVVRRVVTDVAKNGLPGDHHFFISFNTREPGVRLSPRLLAQYPEDMTIVLQHQFWDLTVHEQAFEVGLSFNGIAERLQIPFAAIKGFFDPSVQFGLQFQTEAEAGGEKANSSDKPQLQQQNIPARKDAPAETVVTRREPEPDEPAAEPDLPEQPKAEVVRLDRYRKK